MLCYYVIFVTSKCVTYHSAILKGGWANLQPIWKGWANLQPILKGPTSKGASDKYVDHAISCAIGGERIARHSHLCTWSIRRLNMLNLDHTRSWTACSSARTSAQRTSCCRNWLMARTRPSTSVVNALQSALVRRVASDVRRGLHGGTQSQHKGEEVRSSAASLSGWSAETKGRRSSIFDSGLASCWFVTTSTRWPAELPRRPPLKSWDCCEKWIYQ